MPHLFKLKSGRNAEISHTNHILPRRFQGEFWYYDMDLENLTETPLKLHTYLLRPGANLNQSFSLAIRSGVASSLERCSSLLTRLMIQNRLVIAINVKRANIPVYQRWPLPLLDACMPQPVNTFCMVPTSPLVWHGWPHQET